MANVLVSPTAKILCIGLNYRDHATEGKFDIPDFPVVFTRYASSLVGDGEALILPEASSKFDYEGELVAVIGKAARHVPEASALKHVSGYTIGMDGSLRDYQRRTSQFTLGKNFDKSGSIGPAIIPADKLPPGAHGLKVQTFLNGELMQDGNTADMIFPVAKLIAEISRVMQLNPSDLIFTGTPAGVGFARIPPVWLKAGDKLEIAIEGIGTLRNMVESEA